MKSLLPVVLLWLHAIFASAAILPSGFIETQLAAGLDPTAMVQAPDGRIFITEKYGAVRVVENGALLPDPMMLLQVDNFNERGLSGIALHPDFQNNGFLYLYFTLPNAGRNRLSRFKVIGNYVDAGSQEILFEGEPLYGTIHNGGAMAFGPDGKLYLAVGDGANGNAAPSMQSLLGKILRLNDDGSIPADNPFYNTNTGKYRAIYASGLRNPFSLTFLQGTQRLFICDVGSDFWEEINEIKPGAFYGWNAIEGYKGSNEMPDNYIDPLFSYSHAEGCAIVGAAFYTSGPFPTAYHERFFFADYCKNEIRLYNLQTGMFEGVFAREITRPLVLLTGPDGSMYYIARGGIGNGSEADNTSSNQGSLWKISYVGEGAPVFSLHPKNTLVSVHESAVFRAYANGAAPISYQWERNGTAIPGATADTLLLSDLTLADSGALLRCLALNGFGLVYSQTAILKVTANQRPLPIITSPPAGFLYAAGIPLSFSGYAVDPETGPMDPDDLTWQIDLHHDGHAHPGMAATPGIESGSFTLPDIGETAENVWVRIYLSARDNAGLSRTVFQDIYPKKAILRIETSPNGIPLRVDGKPYTSPMQSTTVSGLRRLVSAPRLVTIGDSIYVFDHWEDGTTFPERSLYPADSLTVLRGYYNPIKTGKGKGLLATYAEGDENGHFGAPILMRVDSVIHFNWGQQSPDPAIPNNLFTVRWEGFVEPLFSGYYTFIVNSDDGCRLWVDGQQLIDFWIEKGAFDVYGHIDLKAGRKYPIVLEYFENGGEASVRLDWATQTMGKTLLPQSQLYPGLPPFSPSEQASLEWVVAPNPLAGAQLRLGVRATHDERLQCRLLDAAGREVAVWQDIPIEEPEQVIELPVAGLAQGLYWLEVSGKVYAGKTVKAVVKG